MNKINILLVFFASAILFSSCSKNDPVVDEDIQIENYITNKKLTVTEKTTSGLRYIRVTPSTGAALKAGQTISVKYAGRFLDDSQFQASSFTFQLGGGQVVKGFDEGIAKMKVGEQATLIFPSSIGYGASGSGPIPANAPLLFNIEVVSAK